MKKSIKKLIASIIPVAMLFTGCGSDITLTDQENIIIADYAAGVLLQYDKNYDDSLIETYPEELTSEAETATEDESQTGEEGSTDDDSQEASHGSESINEVLGIDGVDIKVNSFSVVDQYADAGGLSSFLAESGKKVIVVKLNVTNNSSESKNINILGKDATYMLSSDSFKAASELTILSDDFTSMNEDYAAGEVKERVILFQVSEGNSDAENMELTVSYGGNTYSVKL